MRFPSTSVAVLGAACVALAGGNARANGRFPSAQQLVVDPGDPSHLVLEATFGVLESSDAGKTWGWICEDLVGYATTEDPALAVTKDGTLLGGVFEGLAVSHDRGCSWAFAGGPTAMQYMIDTAVEPVQPSHAVAVTSTGTANGFNVLLVETLDDGKTWTQAGAPAPSDFIAETVEVAPSNPQRVYLSGLTEPALAGAIERTDDRGKNWTRYPVDLMGGGGAYIGAVDPKDPDRVYVRVEGATSDLLLMSPDGGVTWKLLYTTKGHMLGFALSPDGATLAIGGPDDGILLASSSDYSFKPVSTVHAKCLRWAAAGLYACADEFKDGFSLGLSMDQAKTFAAVYHLSKLGVLTCPASSPFAATCLAEWPAIAETLGVDPNTSSSGSGSSSSSGAASGSSSSGSPGAGVTSPPPGGSSGCGCAVPDGGGAGAGLAAAAALLGLARRRRLAPRRSRSRRG